MNKGDLVTMISATFGDEMWSARNAGLGMIMQAIKVGLYVRDVSTGGWGCILELDESVHIWPLIDPFPLQNDR